MSTGPVQAQTGSCSGNLGENIFTQGDFGSGPDNILPNDPGIAPGYSYTVTPPPQDGYYLITNNTGEWANIYSVWFSLPDNSDDPDGYMMVVNASYDPGLFYRQTVDGLCENTTYEFSADIINIDRAGLTGRIKPNVSFLLDSEVFLSTGDIENDEQWHTYGFTFTTAPGQTSLELALRNNAPGGLGNDLALDNISFRPCGPEALILPVTPANICEDGDPIDLEATISGNVYDNPVLQWQQSSDGGGGWTDIPGAVASTYSHTELASGTYYYRYLLAASEANLQNSKCRVISNVKAVHVIPKHYTLSDTICAGLTYTLGGQAIRQSGQYVDSLISSVGCDSIVTLNLTVVPDSGLKAVITIRDPGCHDSRDGSIQLEEVLGGYSPFAVHVTEISSGTALQSVDDLAAGAYELQLTDRFGCMYVERIILENPPPLVVELGTDRMVPLGDIVRLTAEVNAPVATAVWDPPDVQDCSGAACLSLAWYPEDDVQLRLLVTTEQGCQATDSVMIRVDRTARIYFPNVFSPNGDGINDRFTVYARDRLVKQVRQLSVYDRWGGLVYEGAGLTPGDPESGWDGARQGEPLPPGVYAFLAELVLLDDRTERLSGEVILLR